MLPKIEIIDVNFIEAYLNDELTVHFRIVSGNDLEYPIKVSV